MKLITIFLVLACAIVLIDAKGKKAAKDDYGSTAVKPRNLTEIIGMFTNALDELVFYVSHCFY